MSNGRPERLAPPAQRFRLSLSADNIVLPNPRFRLQTGQSVTLDVSDLMKDVGSHRFEGAVEDDLPTFTDLWFRGTNTFKLIVDATGEEVANTRRRFDLTPQITAFGARKVVGGVPGALFRRGEPVRANDRLKIEFTIRAGFGFYDFDQFFDLALREDRSSGPVSLPVKIAGEEKAPNDPSVIISRTFSADFTVVDPAGHTFSLELRTRQPGVLPPFVHTRQLQKDRFTVFPPPAAAPSIVRFAGFAKPARGAPPPESTRIVVQQKQPLVLSWTIAGDFDELTLTGDKGDRKVEADSSGAGSIELDPADFPPLPGGDYRLVASFHSLDSPASTVKVLGILDFRVKLNDQQSHPPSIHQLFDPGMHPLDTVAGEAGSFNFGDPNLNKGAGQRFEGQVTPRSDLLLLWKLTTAEGVRVELDVNRQSKRDVTGSMLGNGGAALANTNPVTRADDPLSTLTFFEANLNLFEDKAGAKGPKLSGSRIRLRLDRKMPGLVEFFATETVGGKEVRIAEGGLASDWSKIRLHWKLEGDSALNTLTVRINGGDKQVLKPPADPSLPPNSPDEGRKKTGSNPAPDPPLTGRVVCRATLDPSATSLETSFFVNPFPRTTADPGKVHLRLRLVDKDGVALAGKSCSVEWAGETIKPPPADSKGMVEFDVPAAALSGKLILTDLFVQPFEVVVSLDELGPADQPEGARGRLNNLAYGPLDPGAKLAAPLDDAASQAIARFQEVSRIVNPGNNVPSGALDAATKDKLEAAHEPP